MSDRYLASFDTAQLAHETVDVLVIGSGIAGVTAAVTSAREGCDTLLVNKAELFESNTHYAKGGIAVPIGDDDSSQAHVNDTVAAGDGLCDEAVVRDVVAAAPHALQFLADCGTNFDLTDAGKPDLAREGGHGIARVLHAGGDATGSEIERAVLHTLAQTPNLRSYRNTFVLDLLTEGRRCVGAIMMRHNELHVVWAGAVVLATGGAGQLYRESSNPPIATADGHAMAIRAGATMRDMELIQFHPTLLYVAGIERTLVTEALRGYGAYLRNSHGDRYMADYHADAELAPRDVVSRAITREMRRTGDAAGFLDVTHIDQADLRERFPTFMACCDDASIDPGKSWVPVRPGPHYMIGGVKSDTGGVCDIERLLIAGEVSSNGLHGANRLASNSLLEGVVVGERAGRGAASTGHDLPRHPRITNQRPIRDTRRLDFPDLLNSLKGAMWRYLGVERDAHGMRELVHQVEGWQRMVAEQERRYPSEWQLENMLAVALAMANSALARKESRGVHFRNDFPGPSAEFAGRHVHYRVAAVPWLE